MSAMTVIPIRNKKLISILNKALVFKEKEFLECINPSGMKVSDEDRKHWVSEEYAWEIMDQKRDHVGFPEHMNAYGFQHNTIKYRNSLPEHVTREHQERVAKTYNEVIGALSEEFCFRTTALFCVYPPKGFISWHNNANASAYNCIFTWSETGDSYFKYYDKKLKEFVTLQDKKGWSCKYGYFGAYEDDWDELVYHSASTTCWRITISFIFDRSPESLELQNWVIEDIQSED